MSSRGPLSNCLAVLLLGLVALAGGGALVWHPDRLLASSLPVPAARAPVEPAGPTVAVAPRVGRPTDTFSFSLAGFAAGETVTVSFSAPLGFDDFPLPDAMAVTVDESGSSSVSLRPVDQGLMLPGTWVVTFTGQTSGATETASLALDCGC